MYRNISYKIGDGYHGNIVLDTWDDDGNPVTKRYVHQSYLYYEDPNGNDGHSVFGTRLTKKMFNNVSDRRKWLETHCTKNIFGCLPATREFLIDMYWKNSQDPDFAKFPLRIHYIDIEIAVVDVFPEPAKADFPINLITVYDSILDQYHVFIFTTELIVFENTENIKYHVHNDEQFMLRDYFEWYRLNKPDVITGWNIEGFDIPYIVNRAYKLFTPAYVDNILSTTGRVRENITTHRGASQVTTSYKIEGVSLLDYFILYKLKFSRGSAQSYKLNNIAQDELGYGKLDYEGSFKDFWTKDFKTFVEYNIRDVSLVVDLEKKLKYLMVARTICNIGLCEYEAIYKSAPVILGSLLIEARGKDVEIPTLGAKESEETPYEGAFVFDPKAGIYRNGVSSLDFNSLYPNIMISLNISPETKVGKVIKTNVDGSVQFKVKSGKILNFTAEKFEKLKTEKNCCVAGNGVVYLNPITNQGIIPKFLDKLYTDRKKNQKLARKYEKNADKVKEAIQIAKGMLEDSEKREAVKLKIEELEKQAKQYEYLAISHTNLQVSQKTLLNSIYGQFGNRYFSMSDVDSAEAVTISGQHMIKRCAEYINEYFKTHYNAEDDVLLSGDTDSVAGTSSIRTNLGIFSIEDLWKIYLTNSTPKVTLFGHEILDSISNIRVMTYDTTNNSAILGMPKRIIRHKVSKEKYKINLNGKSVIVTGDHSCVIIKDNTLQIIAAKDIKPGDNMVTII